MEKIKIKHVGFDSWDREVFQTQKGTYVEFGLFASEYEALHEEQQRVRRGAGYGPQNRRIRDRR